MLQVLICLLDPGNLVDMLQAYGARYLVAWSAGAFFNAGRLLQKVRGRRRFCNKRECSVRLHIDERRSGCARLNVGRFRVELFAEIHRLDATSTQRGTNWG